MFPQQLQVLHRGFSSIRPFCSIPRPSPTLRPRLLSVGTLWQRRTSRKARKTLSRMAASTSSGSSVSDSGWRRRFSSSSEASRLEAISNPRRIAQELFHAAVEAADPHRAVSQRLRHHPKDPGRSELVLKLDSDAEFPVNRERFRKVLVLGAGKASVPMAQAVLDALRTAGLDWTACHVITKYGHSAGLLPGSSGASEKISIAEAGHPVMDEATIQASRKMVDLLRTHDSEETLVLFLLSGGASALLELPAEGIPLAELAATNALLLESGASIHEINTVRKHLSTTKGGRLLETAPRSHWVSLVLSDVIGDNLEVIGSGPTVADPSSFQDCDRVLKNYQLWDRLPENVRGHLERGLRGEEPETPKEVDSSKIHTLVVGSNRVSLRAVEDKSRELGYEPRVVDAEMQGEAQAQAVVFAELAKQIMREAGNQQRVCLIGGGETTVTLGSKVLGKGGRNQEMALRLGLELAGTNGITALCAGTDGTDGPTDAAGGIVDGDTIPRGRDLGLDAEKYLEEHDSYRYLEAVGGLFITGPTGTNVMDITVVLCDSN